MAIAQDPWDDPQSDQIDPELTKRLTAQNTGVAGPSAPSAPASGFDRTQFRDSWMSSAAGLSPTDFINQNPSFASGVTSFNGSKDKFALPTGEVLDLSINSDANGVGGKGWTGTGANAQGVPDSPSSFGGAGGAAGSAPQGSDFQQQMRALLMGQLQGLSQPVTGQDPAIKGVNDAYRVARERSAQQERGAAAERAAFEGLNSGGQGSGSFDSAVQGIQEQSGQDIAGHDASTVLGEVQQRRQQLTQLLNLAVQSGDAESARALQAQIAQMDNQYRYANLGQQQSQFNDTYGANRADAQNDYLRWAIDNGYANWDDVFGSPTAG